MKIPDRGDVVWVDFNPEAELEKKDQRPAFVLSPKEYNVKVGLALFCSVTRDSKGYPFEVELPEGLAVEGVILSDHVNSLDWKARQVGFICSLPKMVVEEVLAKLDALLSSRHGG